MLGSLDELASFIRTQPVDQVVITLPQHAANRRLACLERLRHLPIDVRLSPDLPGLGVQRARHRRGRRHAAAARVRPALAGSAWLAKAVEDRVLAAIVLVLAAPMMLVLAGLVRIGSPGPVLYRQRRYGFDNRPIEVLKFRTMYVDRCAESAGRSSPRSADDPARHPDRPRLAQDQPRRAAAIPQRAARRDVRGGPAPARHGPPRALRRVDRRLSRPASGAPGITGWAQVNGLRGGADTLARMQERVRYDLHYIENWSLLLDLRIILRTLLVGFSHPNAY